MNTNNYKAIYELAHRAGMDAVKALQVNPMYVTDGRTTWKVDDGLCGFASIHFMGNTSFGKWAKANNIAQKHWKKGLYIWVGDFNQSYERKSAYASAFARYLKENGIDAWSESRLD